MASSSNDIELQPVGASLEESNTPTLNAQHDNFNDPENEIIQTLNGDDNDNDNDNDNDKDDDDDVSVESSRSTNDSIHDNKSIIDDVAHSNENDEILNTLGHMPQREKLSTRMWRDIKWGVKSFFISIVVFIVMAVVFLAVGHTKMTLTYEAWATGFIIILQVAWLLADVVPPHLVVFWSMALLMIMRILTPAETLVGFANSSVHSIGCVLVVTENILRSGFLDVLARYLLGAPRWIMLGQARLLYPVAVVSAFVPDTPTVATFLPIVQKWVRQRGFPPSYFLMPLSFTALLGGTMTIIGTSTNLVVLGLIERYKLDISVGFFDIATVGAPVALAGVTYLVLLSRCCLPARGDAASDTLKRSREYTCHVRVQKGSSLVKCSIARSGLRNLSGLYLYEIQRADGAVLIGPSPDTILLGGDVLAFTGLVSSLADVLRMDGLVSIESDQVEKIEALSHQRVLLEAIISSTSSLVGRTPKRVKFRSRFNAAIIAIARHGERVEGKIGDIVLQPNDVMLLESDNQFLETYRFDENFVLVAELDHGSVSPAKSKMEMLFAILCLAIPIIANITLQYCEWDGEKIGYPIYSTLLLSVCIIILLRFMTTTQAIAAAKPGILLTIAGSFALGEAVSKTGLGMEMAHFLLPIFEIAGAFGVLLGLFIIVSVMNSFVSNAAAMTIMFPIAVDFVEQKAISLRSMIYVMMMAGSADFCTPVGYQTNLMVYGPGGYRFFDYTIFGFPLMVLDALITTVICYAVFEM